MLYWIKMDVVSTALKIVLIPNRMLPEALLPKQMMATSIVKKSNTRLLE
jgi:hypothetical protein